MVSYNHDVSSILICVISRLQVFVPSPGMAMKVSKNIGPVSDIEEYHSSQLSSKTAIYQYCSIPRVQSDFFPYSSLIQSIYAQFGGHDTTGDCIKSLPNVKVNDIYFFPTGAIISSSKLIRLLRHNSPLIT